MTPRYRDHHERVNAQLAAIASKKELAEIAWQLLHDDTQTVTVEERAQAKKAIRSAQNLTRAFMQDPIIYPERKALVRSTHARLTHMTEKLKQRPQNKAA